jgi:FixJ family two-component response regulator
MSNAVGKGPNAFWKILLLWTPMGKASQTDAVRPVVIIIDDDVSVLKALARLIRAGGYDVRTFSEPSALLADDLPIRNACMVVDVNLPEMNGAELCEALAAGGRLLPVIFITGRTDVRTQELTRRVPAVAVLFKPFHDTVLLPAISRALKSAPL